MKLDKKWLEKAKEHRAHDRFVQGQWFDDNRGCFFGCLMETSDNTLTKASKEMGLPLEFIQVLERIFESLPPEEAVEFPVQILTALSERDVNIDNVIFRFEIKLLERVKTYVTIDNWGVTEAINSVIEALKTELEIDAASNAAYAAEKTINAAAYAAYAAEKTINAAAYAAYAASNAADAAYAADAADYAADAADYAADAADAAARTKERQNQCNDLLDLLSSN